MTTEAAFRGTVALGKLKDPRATGHLLDALRGPSARIEKRSRRMRWTHWEITSKSSRCSAAVSDPSPLVRGVAARSLAKLDDPRIVDPLIGVLELESCYSLPVEPGDPGKPAHDTHVCRSRPRQIQEPAYRGGSAPGPEASVQQH